MEKIAILIPCYNEAVTIQKVVEDCRAAMPEACVYVYDNNSTDGTAQIAEAAGAVVRCEHLQGKGNVIRRMLREIDAECYIMLDGDDTYPAEHLPDMAAPILEKRAEMVVGDRLSSTYFTENKRPFHNSGNRLVRGSINLLFKSDVKDIMTGYRALSYDFAKTLPVTSKGFEIETEMTIHAANYNMAVAHVEVDYRDRPDGSESKLNTVTDGIRVLRTILGLFKNYKPMTFFTLLAIALVLAALGLFIPFVLLPYLQSGFVDQFPTLIVCGFMALAALISFFIGLILDTIVKKDRAQFEFNRQLVQMLRDKQG